MSLISDIRIAARRLHRNPGYALGVVVTLALGIAVCAAMYSVVHGVVLRGLDYPEPGRLLVLRAANTAKAGEPMQLAGAEADSLGELGRSIESAGYYFWGGATYLGGQTPRMVTAIHVGGDFFDTLGTPPLLGRWLTAADQGAQGRVVLSHELWMELFGGDPDVVGKPFRMDWITADIVGVMPPQFGYPARGVGLWIAHDPAQVRADPALYQNARFFFSIARMKPAATPSQVAQELALHSRALADREGAALADWRLQATSMLDDTVGPVRPVLYALLTIAALALLVACANVVNLVVLRGVSRLQELGVRQALGASGGRLARIVFVETLLAGVLASAAGVMLAMAGLKLFVGLGDSGLPRADEVTLDFSMIAVAVAFGIVASVVAAAVPALRLRRIDAAGALRSGNARQAGSLELGRISRVLPVASGALSVGGLAAALLLATSVWRLEHVPAGFEADPVLTLQIFRDADAEAAAFSRELLRRMQALPGVEAVATLSAAPLSGIGAIPVDVQVVGRDGEEALHPAVRTAAGPVQDVLGLELLRGRWFDEGDREGAEPVALVNHAFAERVFGGTDAIGEVVSIPPFGAGGARRRFRIVGVMADARMATLARPAGPELWVPAAQYPVTSIAVLLRSGSDPQLLARPAQAVLWALRPDAGIYQVRTLAELRDRQLATPRFFARNAGAFALLALVLAAIGVHSVVAYRMAQRRREFALRLALGSSPRQLAGRVLRTGYGIGLPAAAGGAALALVFGQFLRSAVVGVEDAVWATAAASALVLLLIVGIACARSVGAAMRVQPMATLRED
ncbi:MAG TPA: ABC transporter permease [Xanthomonadaceae bacterium]|nr:ABC transporter permease [Xanthomonadaceae bacterium]